MRVTLTVKVTVMPIANVNSDIPAKRASYVVVLGFVDVHT